MAILNNSLERAIPCKYKYPPWWDENLTHMRAKLRKVAKTKPLKAGIPIPLLGESIKKQLKLQKVRDGRNSPLKLNIQVMFQNLSKVSTTAKIMH